MNFAFFIDYDVTRFNVTVGIPKLMYHFQQVHPIIQVLVYLGGLEGALLNVRLQACAMAL